MSEIKHICKKCGNVLTEGNWLQVKSKTYPYGLYWTCINCDKPNKEYSKPTFLIR